jgi:hypothetical protein
MATYNKFNIFTENLLVGYHNFSTSGGDTLKVMLTDVLPVNTNTVFANITDIAAGNGYTAGGTATTSNTLSTSGGTAKFVSTGPVFTASGGAIAQFRYAVLYQSVAANTVSGQPTKPLIAWWDYGSEVNLSTGETFTVSFDGTNGVFTVA